MTKAYKYAYNGAMLKRISLWVGEDHLAKLRALSKRTGAPVAELIRRAIEAYLKKA